MPILTISAIVAIAKRTVMPSVAHKDSSAIERIAAMTRARIIRPVTRIIVNGGRWAAITI